MDTLCDLYDTVTVAQAVIFANTKRKVDWLTNMMKSRDFAVSALVSLSSISIVTYALLFLLISTVK